MTRIKKKFHPFYPGHPGYLVKSSPILFILLSTYVHNHLYFEAGGELFSEDLVFVFLG